MKKLMVPFAPPHIDEECIEEVVSVLRSGWITTGPKTKLFEENLSEYLGEVPVVCVGSATQGMELILRWFGVGPGDEVIIPAYTYCATANVVLHCGAKPVMVDILDNFLIDPAEIEKKITERTKVIIPVDVGGFPCNYKEILKLAEKHATIFKPGPEIQRKLGRILVMGDAAHSFGAIYNQQKIGKVADVAVFSFHAVKNLTTAEGGAISLNLPEEFNCYEIKNQLKTLSLHGQSKDAFTKAQKGGWRYDVLNVGFKCNMTDIQAALGLVQLRNYAQDLKKRAEIFEFYSKTLKKYKWARLPLAETSTEKSSCHVYMLRINAINEMQRDKIMQEVAEEGVSVNVHFQPLPLLTVYKELGYNIEDYPKAYSNYSNEISLPVFFHITKEQQQQVLEVLIRVVENILQAKDKI